jgi:guanidinoacetate N-methyltransferase
MPNDDFMATPQGGQRNWLLQRALNEWGCDLQALDRISRRMVHGGERPEIVSTWKTEPVRSSPDELVIDGQQVMQAWERPLMAALADVAAASHGDVLEVGFGMGIAATFLQERGLRSHTILECNDDVAKRLAMWAGRYPEADIRIIGSRWQDWEGPEGTFDAILFDTYPTSEEEFLREVYESPTFSASFFPRAAQLLRPGGVFTYYSNEIDSLGREHQRLLLQHFQSFSVSLVRGLTPPSGCQYWWADSMAVVKAVK